MVDPLPSEKPETGLPEHVAIIMDGNGRWAKARHLPRTAGHKRGADTVRRIIEAARRMGIGYLTLYAFSSENWKRPESEVNDLMGLLRLYLRHELATLAKNGIRFKVIGDRSRLSPDIVALVEETEAKTASNVAMTLVVALSYGGRQEIADTARMLARAAAAGRIDPEAIDEDVFAQGLSTSGIPDPDLLIRTSGEQRMSNFLLWQCAYSELVFVDTLWPDFTEEEFAEAVAEFRRRDRRYGASAG